MLRTIASVIAAYIVMTIFMFTSFTTLYFVLGAEGSFQPNRFDVSTFWLICSFILGFIATIVGGFVAVWFAKKQTAALAFGGVVLTLSLIIAFVALSQGNPSDVRAGNTPSMEAMQKAQQPVWFNFLIPFTGFAGALIGGKFKKTEEPKIDTH